MIQVERSLQAEVMLMAQSLRPDCIICPIPNGVWLPARSPEEQRLVNRLIARMIDEGQMLPGAGDLAVLWGTGSACIELKKPATRDLFGKRSPAGRPSPAQKEFAVLCAAHGVRHVYAHSWGEVLAALTEWGRLG